MRKFYLFVQKGHAMRAELSWTHYRYLLPIKDDRTVGVIICKDINGYVLKYCTDDRIFTTTYNLINV